MKYFALSALLMAFCTHAGDKPTKMAPGAFAFGKAELSVPDLSQPANVSPQNGPEPVDFKRHTERKKRRDSQYTMRPPLRKALPGKNPTRVIRGLVLPHGQGIRLTREQGAIFVFTLLPVNKRATNKVTGFVKND
jgi:hypothetical protein